MNNLEQESLKKVTQNPASIASIKDPSEAVQLASVRKNGYAVQYIKDPSNEVRLAAVQQNGSAITFIQDPSEEMKLAAIRENGFVLQHIKFPSAAVQLAAVQQSGMAIKYLNDPDEATQLVAIHSSPWALQFIKTPTVKAQLSALNLDFFTLSVCQESFTPTHSDFIEALSVFGKDFATRESPEDLDDLDFISALNGTGSFSDHVAAAAKRCSALMSSWTDEQAISAFRALPPILQQHKTLAPFLHQSLQDTATQARQDDPALPRKPNAL